MNQAVTPQALEWLAFDPESDTRGSLVAVGAMDPLIQVLVLVLVVAVLVVAVLVVAVLVVANQPVSCGHVTRF